MGDILYWNVHPYSISLCCLHQRSLIIADTVLPVREVNVKESTLKMLINTPTRPGIELLPVRGNPARHIALYATEHVSKNIQVTQLLSSTMCLAVVFILKKMWVKFHCFRKSTKFVLSSISCENLLTMRPRGVRSKNDTGAVTTAENNKRWKRFDALISTCCITPYSDIG